MTTNPSPTVRLARETLTHATTASANVSEMSRIELCTLIGRLTSTVKTLLDYVDLTQQIAQYQQSERETRARMKAQQSVFATEVEGAIRAELPGGTALRIDTTTRVIAVDGISGVAYGDLLPRWQVHDLRDGTYGDFHRLTPSGACFDAECAKSEHIDVQAEDASGGAR